MKRRGKRLMRERKRREKEERERDLLANLHLENEKKKN